MVQLLRKSGLPSADRLPPAFVGGDEIDVIVRLPESERIPRQAGKPDSFRSQGAVPLVQVAELVTEGLSA